MSQSFHGVAFYGILSSFSFRLSNIHGDIRFPRWHYLHAFPNLPYNIGFGMGGHILGGMANIWGIWACYLDKQRTGILHLGRTSLEGIRAREQRAYIGRSQNRRSFHFLGSRLKTKVVVDSVCTQNSMTR
jgi:hypothetical protein